jgi:hypothetical protein
MNKFSSFINTMVASNDKRKCLCFVFSASLLLSAISFASDSIIGRDGLLYVETALIAQTDIQGAFARFDWPWFPILIGWLSKGSGIEPEYLWRILSGLMTAVACAITVDMVSRKRPELIFWAALAVLSVPAFNNYRDDIIRENGFWCFSMCALWMIFAYEADQRAKYLSGMVVAIFIAASFRPEALAFLLVYPIWKGYKLSKGSARRVYRCFPIIILIAGALIIMTAGYLMALKYGLLPRRLHNLGVILMSFLNDNWFSVSTKYNTGLSTAAIELAKILPYKYSREDTKSILFFGIFFYLVWKTIRIFGPFAIPVFGNYLFGSKSKPDDIDLTHHQNNPWLITDIAAGIYFGVLVVFTTHHLFVSSRYLALMGFLLLPRIAVSLSQFTGHWPRLKTTVFIISAIVAFANVTHTNPPKNHLRDAGIWVGKNLKMSDDIYLTDARIAYYAGWRLPAKMPNSLDAALAGPYSYFIIEPDSEDEAKELSEKGLVAIATFRNTDKKMYVVFQKDGL